MKPFLLAATAAFVAGALCLLAAPVATSCISGSDFTACETIGTIVLNVAGGGFLALGAGLLLMGARATR